MPREQDRVVAGARDDAAPLEALAADRVEAVGEAYDRHAGSLYRLALLVVGDPGLAERAVEHAFVVLWSGSGTVDPRKHGLRTALAADVYDNCLEARTRRDLRERYTGQAAQPHPGPRSPVLAAFAGLPCLQQDLLALMLLGDHTCREAAHQVGLTETAALRLITAGLQALTRALDDGDDVLQPDSRAPEPRDAAPHEQRYGPGIGQQLQDALTSRVVIQRATGVLAEHARISVDAALARMRAHAQAHACGLGDVARDLVEGRLDPATLAETRAAHLTEM